MVRELRAEDSPHVALDGPVDLGDVIGGVLLRGDRADPVPARRAREKGGVSGERVDHTQATGPFVAQIRRDGVADALEPVGRDRVDADAREVRRLRRLVDGPARHARVERVHGVDECGADEQVGRVHVGRAQLCQAGRCREVCRVPRQVDHGIGQRIAYDAHGVDAAAPLGERLCLCSAHDLDRLRCRRRVFHVDEQRGSRAADPLEGVDQQRNPVPASADL